MTLRYHYDENGRYRGRSFSDLDQGLAFLGWMLFLPFVLMALYFALRWIWHGMLGYSKLALPYKWLVGYYYFTVGVPYAWADAASRWAMKSTPWPNLNFVLGGVVLLATLLSPYATAIALLRRMDGGWRLLRTAAFGPLLILIAWWVGARVVEWLLAK